MGKQFIVTSIDRDKKSGGSKAKKDIVHFLKKNLNFENYNLSVENSNKLYIHWFMNVNFRHFVKQQKPSLLLFQYPNLSFYVMNKMVTIYRHYCPHGKIVFLVHDIMGIQFQYLPDILSQEIELFNRTDGLIVHNEKMNNYLTSKGVRVPMSNLGLFDYDSNTPLSTPSDSISDVSICFTGNLGKSEFLRDLNINTPIHLYGTNPASSYPNNMVYKGYYSADKIGDKLTEQYGLVWDGNDIHTCAGSLGKYLKLNDPHKASLYLSSGIPIIIWSEAALADIVLHYNAGIVVDDLTQIDERLRKISYEQYKQMRNNAKELGKQIRQGFYVTHSVKELIKKIQ
ncbi:galactofuranosyltransferase [Limosilactobacillus secaliphilus]|nr:galactofuranosyltransferase [Limosilactobacillus secaliphilus]